MMTQQSRAMPQPMPQPSFAVTGMKVFLASEALFFLVLILAFFYLRANTSPQNLQSSHGLNPLRTGIFTLCLVASSGTVWLADRGIRTQNRRALGLWLGITLLLGVIFLAGQFTEYLGLLAQGVTISSDVFSTQFYTLTGLHFLHVTAGALALAVLFGFVLAGKSSEPGAGALESVSLYWHFVDVVWIVLFVTLYLAGT